MLSYVDLYQEVTVKIAFLAQFYVISVAHSFWYGNLLLAILGLMTTALAAGTELLYLFSLPTARVTGGLHDEHSLSHSLGTCTVTGIAFLRGSAWLAFIPFAGFAGYCPLILDSLSYNVGLPW